MQGDASGAVPRPEEGGRVPYVAPVPERTA
jgi:hypothetical protein